MTRQIGMVLALWLAGCGGSSDGGKADGSVNGAMADARVADAGPDAPPLCAASPTGTCNFSMQFCYSVAAGDTNAATADDAALPAIRGCNATPAVCLPSATCACILANGNFPPSSTCENHDGLIQVTTNLP